MTTPEQAVRPWGSYTVLEAGEGYKVKRIIVAAGRRLSYQSHEKRAEHWFVVSGEGAVTLEGETLSVASGSTVDVARGAKHRIENTGGGELVFIEVQHGEYFGEDDIVRYEDDFGRVGAHEA